MRSCGVLVHRRADSLHAASPHSVARVLLRFTSFAVANLRADFNGHDTWRHPKS